jgi:endonuclease/exonuclease/phosphatase family metal-dependent hydrolase
VLNKIGFSIYLFSILIKVIKNPELEEIRDVNVNSFHPLVDAWQVRHAGVAHPATFKIYEKDQPGDPELHCDFIFVGEEAVPRLGDIRVNRETQAADHQPVILTLA